LILHSDQGAQYTSQDYHDALTKEGQIRPSMSRRGNCWDNAPMENFFGHLKEEYLRQFKKPPLKKWSNSLTNTSTFTTMRGYN
jgi:transposase InsO family protein